MKGFIWILIACLIPGCLAAQSFKKLPDWAIPVFEDACKSPKPADDVNDWVLLDRTEFAYTGDGEIITHRYLLTEVLTDQGINASRYILAGLGGHASKVKKLKGWNLRPDGELVKLERENVVAIEKAGDSEGVTNRKWTGAVLDGVVRGSIVAFEAIQTETDPVGPIIMSPVLGGDPIFRWEVSAATKGGWFTNLKKVSMRLTPRHFSPWIPAPRIVTGNSISADNLPAVPREESVHPPDWNVLPLIELTFLDPDLKDVPPFSSWDGIATWEETKFGERAMSCKLPDMDPLSDLEGLRAIHRWMCANLTYKQVYLTPDRGYAPSFAAEVTRRRYGDCKDLAACFIAAVRAAGLEAFPVLARIEEGRIEADEAVTLASFNHVIAAVRLKGTLGLPSEVETPKGRFLLVDLTARLTPLGRLPVSHRRGRVMICAEGKAVWVQIPDKALEAPNVDVRLTGEADALGRLTGAFQIKEGANARRFRSGALGLDPAAFCRFIASDFFYLPPNAKLEVVRHSDPMDIDHPFEIELTLDHPKGFTLHGGEWDLEAMGIFRVVLPLIQRTGQARHYPVEFDNPERLEVQAELSTPVSLTPVLPKSELSTPFQKISWSAGSEPAKGGGSRLTIHLVRENEYATFGFESREMGISEWIKGRRSTQSLVEDALAFEVRK